MLEVADAAAERVADLRQTLGAENEQHDEQNQQQVCGLDNLSEH
jgi:hypothetical protein